MSGFELTRVSRTYGAIAEDYARTYADHLQQVELDRALLDHLAERVGTAGPVLDVGCGPGHVGRYLTGQGCVVVGIDASREMLALARRLNPGWGVLLADMMAMPLQASRGAGLVAFYVLHHVPRAELPIAFREFRRVLLTGGQLLLAAHRGTGEFRVTGAGGLDIRGTLYSGDEISTGLGPAGFRVDIVEHRAPLPY